MNSYFYLRITFPNLNLHNYFIKNQDIVSVFENVMLFSVIDSVYDNVLSLSTTAKYGITDFMKF